MVVYSLGTDVMLAAHSMKGVGNMGCDIHMYKEKKVGGKWVAADVWVDSGDGYMEVPWENRFTHRNYELFGFLAKGVRRSHKFSFVARGLPMDACPEVKECSNEWGEDGHSHSYLYLHELRDAREAMSDLRINVSGMKDREGLAALNASIDSGNPDWDLIFPYCQFSTSNDYEEFSFDVPALLYFREGLDEIIASFDGVDGENQRIVFFFDN